MLPQGHTCPRFAAAHLPSRRTHLPSAAHLPSRRTSGRCGGRSLRSATGRCAVPGGAGSGRGGGRFLRSATGRCAVPGGAGSGRGRGAARRDQHRCLVPPGGDPIQPLLPKDTPFAPFGDAPTRAMEPVARGREPRPDVPSGCASRGETTGTVYRWSKERIGSARVGQIGALSQDTLLRPRRSGGRRQATE